MVYLSATVWTFLAPLSIKHEYKHDMTEGMRNPNQNMLFFKNSSLINTDYSEKMGQNTETSASY